MNRERWMFTAAELQDPSQCTRDDEFVCVDPAVNSEQGVICNREGQPTNRYEDGICGVPQKIKDDIVLMGEDYVKVHRDTAGCLLAEEIEDWREVLVTDSGEFVAFQ